MRRSVVKLMKAISKMATMAMSMVATFVRHELSGVTMEVGIHNLE